MGIGIIEVGVTAGLGDVLPIADLCKETLKSGDAGVRAHALETAATGLTVETSDVDAVVLERLLRRAAANKPPISDVATLSPYARTAALHNLATLSLRAHWLSTRKRSRFSERQPRMMSNASEQPSSKRSKQFSPVMIHRPSIINDSWLSCSALSGILTPPARYGGRLAVPSPPFMTTCGTVTRLELRPDPTARIRTGSFASPNWLLTLPHYVDSSRTIL